MTYEEQALNNAVEGLYVTFAGYPLAKNIQGCPCCVSDEDESSLHRKPLRELSAEDLTRYAFKSLTTWGTVSDHKHFLPRLLELVTEKDGIAYGIDLAVLFGKLDYADWNTWDSQERAAVRRYLMTLWLFVLSVPTEAVTVSEYLCAIGQAEEDLLNYLNTWQNLQSDIALNHLVEFVEAQGSLHKGKLTDAFWGGRRCQMLQVVGWLKENGLG